MPGTIKVLIQVEAGSRDKHLYDEKTMAYKGACHVAQGYPYPYGFIIGTYAADGDAMDCYLITKDKVPAGTVVECEPVGLLEQYEGDEVDHKVLAVLPGQHVKAGSELLKELQEFIYLLFTAYPEVSIRVGPLQSRAAAIRHIQKSQNL